MTRDIAALIAEARERAGGGNGDLRTDAEVFGQLADALVELRRLTTQLHRRAQVAEGVVARAGLVENRPQGPQGRGLGRILANYAAALYQRERDEARAELAAQRSRYDVERRLVTRIAMALGGIAPPPGSEQGGPEAIPGVIRWLRARLEDAQRALDAAAARQPFPRGADPAADVAALDEERRRSKSWQKAYKLFAADARREREAATAVSVDFLRERDEACRQLAAEARKVGRLRAELVQAREAAARPLQT